MPNVYTWKGHIHNDDRIAVDERDDVTFATVYVVEDDYRYRVDEVLGVLMKFNAVDPDTFDGPFEMTMEEIDKKYGPVLTGEEIEQHILNKLGGQ